MVVRLIFLAVFASLIGHIARYAPSSRDENISKNISRKSYQVIFSPSHSDEGLGI